MLPTQRIFESIKNEAYELNASYTLTFHTYGCIYATLDDMPDLFV